MPEAADRIFPRASMKDEEGLVPSLTFIVALLQSNEPTEQRGQIDRSHGAIVVDCELIGRIIWQKKPMDGKNK